MTECHYNSYAIADRALSVWLQAGRSGYILGRIQGKYVVRIW